MVEERIGIVVERRRGSLFSIVSLDRRSRMSLIPCSSNSGLVLLSLLLQLLEYSLL
jgi:hypothetical protein